MPNNYWKNEKKRLKKEAWAVEQAAAEKERMRKDALSMYERIEESDASAELKDILHRMAEFLGLENQ